MKIKVTADSTCDLPQELIDKYDIGITPLYIVKDGVSYKDGLEISPDDIFEHVKKGGSLCSTSAVSVGDYIGYFTPLLETYDAIVHLCISSDMSSCYANACLAAEELGRVWPVDARNLSTGIGHLVLDAAILAGEGMDAADIQAELCRRREKLDVSFVIDTLEFLHKGGRCSTLSMLGANLLNLKPCIEVKDGRMGVAKKYRGSLKKCFIAYIRDRLSVDDIDYRRIFITDSGIDDALAEELMELIRSLGPFEEVIHSRAGCTVSNHCGPRTMGVLFYRK